MKVAQIQLRASPRGKPTRSEASSQRSSPNRRPSSIGSRISLAFCRKGMARRQASSRNERTPRMNPRKLIITMATLALLAGAGVAGAFAGNSTSSPATSTVPQTTTTCSDDQGEQAENDEQEAADEVESAATQVDQEAARARHFRLDALRARKGLAAVQPSSARGRRAKRLALAAFYDYAIVGRQWALSGQARVRGLRVAAVGHARIAARYARRGSALLLAAKRLLG